MLTVTSLERSSTPTSFTSKVATPIARSPIDVNSTTISCIPKSSSFYKLISDLKSILGTEGLTSDDIDIEQVKTLMENYDSNEMDWAHLALHEPTRNYTRNGIININGNANLLILAWSPGKSLAIHDHANAHCCMKILGGELVESLYDVPEQEGHELVSRKHTSLYRDQVGYIADNIGLHKISNPLDEVSYSLHLYTPPYASMFGCSMYEAGNGKKHHVDMSKYYSWQGELVNPKGGSTC